MSEDLSPASIRAGIISAALIVLTCALLAWALDDNFSSFLIRLLY